ncbi:MFS transporter [Nocardiopsis synnemataformans]|uniref:MFS transporter n=1 Tax=Nocardiopsis synnemataformans TaxID=61305 RepID=UPI003EB7DBAB
MGYLRVLRHRRVLGLWGAQLLAVVGARLYALAVMWLVWQATGSAFLMGLVAVLESVPYILMGAFGRRLVARLATWRRLAAVELLRAAVVATVPLVWALPEARVAVLLAVALLIGVTGSVVDPLLPALAPSLVRDDQVRPVMGLLDLTGRIARILGPGAAGALLLVVREVDFYWLTAAGFAASALALALLGRAEPACRARPAASAPSSGDGEDAAGWRVVLSHPPVMAALALNGCGILAGTAAAIGLPILLTTVHGAGMGVYGLLTALTAAGAVVGNLVVGNLAARGRWLGVFCAAWAASGVLLAGMGMASTVGVLALILALSGAAAPWAGVTLHAHLAERFSAAERVGVLSAHHMVMRTCGTAGMLVVPVLVAANPPLVFALAGLVLVAAATAAGLAGARLPERSGELVGA